MFVDGSWRGPLFELWREKVESEFVFRGMSAKDLRDPLDPSIDPFRPVKPRLFELIEVLERLVGAGLRFDVREEHFGQKYVSDLGVILLWTRRDLNNSGIDFTSSYCDACEYADCYQGSQLKENFKYITDHLPSRESDPVVQAHMTEREWSLVSEINNWISEESTGHRSIVVWVRRSCPAFDRDPRCLPVGSFDFFSSKILDALKDRGLPCTRDTANQVLPKEDDGFTVRLCRALNKEDIERIEEVTLQKVTEARRSRTSA